MSCARRSGWTVAIPTENAAREGHADRWDRLSRDRFVETMQAAMEHSTTRHPWRARTVSGRGLRLVAQQRQGIYLLLGVNPDGSVTGHWINRSRQQRQDFRGDAGPEALDISLDRSSPSPATPTPSATPSPRAAAAHLRHRLAAIELPGSCFAGWRTRRPDLGSGGWHGILRRRRLRHQRRGGQAAHLQGGCLQDARHRRADLRVGQRGPSWHRPAPYPLT